MADFPVLDSGVLAQYPLRRTSRFATHVMQFVDGSEQRFRQHGRGATEWELRLSSLSSGEARRLSQFADQQAGQAGEFVFQDPLGGAVGECHLASDSFVVMQVDDQKHAVQVKVKG